MKTKVFTAYRYIKTKFFTASIFFTLAVILFGGLTFIELPCPVCDGSGVIAGTKDLEITGIEAELVDHKIVSLECGWDFERYVYDIKMTIENNTLTPLYGIVKITFHDPRETRIRWVSQEDEPAVAEEVPGGVIGAETIFIDELGAGTERTIEETIVFDATELELLGVEKHDIIADTAQEFPCPFHGQTAKVPLTEWLTLR